MKREFDQGRTNPPVHPTHPRSAGTAIWVRGLLNRMKIQMNTLQQSIFIRDFALDACNEANNEYNQVLSSLEEYIKKVTRPWALWLIDFFLVV